MGAPACAAILVALVLSACGGNTPPPGPGASLGTPPDLRGARVLVLPVQQVLGVSGDPDAELAFGLLTRTQDVGWVLAHEVEEVLARSPGINASTRGLGVGHFLQAEVRRIGDPLFGQLRRLAALVDTDAVLLPVEAAVAADVGEGPRIRWSVALISVRTGRVPWFSVVEGEAFPADDPRGLASSVDRLARTLLWYVGR